MKKLTIIGLITLLACGVAFGQAAKTAVKVSEMALLAEHTTDNLPDSTTWVSLLGAEPVLIKNGSGSKDFIVGVSLECGTYNYVKVSGKNGGSATADTTAGLRVRVVLDKGTPNEQIAVPYADPNVNGGEFAGAFGDGIVFCRKDMELSATLGGVIDSCDFDCALVCTEGCLDIEGNTAEDCCVADCSFDVSEDCLVTDEDISLALRSLTANHFNFLLVNVGQNASGVNYSGATHTVDVEVAIDLGKNEVTNLGDATAEAKAAAMIGRGTVTVQQVRLIKDADYIWDPQ